MLIGPAAELCDLIKRMLDQIPAFEAYHIAKGNGNTEADGQSLWEGVIRAKAEHVLIDLKAALVSCCHVDRLRVTGRLLAKPQFSGLPMHDLVAPLLIRLDWPRSKVSNIIWRV